MINEFTALLAQSHWIRDGGNNGMGHARSNLSEALGAMGFLFPWGACRWTNNPDQMDANNDELTRFYCRSAMMGTWGIVADLPRIGEHQRAVICEEVAHYRRLNAFKTSCLYDLQLPGRGANAAGVTFYKPDGRGAGVVLYRWNAKGSFTHTLDLAHLNAAERYCVEDADAKTITEAEGQALQANGLDVPFPQQRLSALVFVEAAE